MDCVFDISTEKINEAAKSLEKAVKELNRLNSTVVKGCLLMSIFGFLIYGQYKKVSEENKKLDARLETLEERVDKIIIKGGING